MTDRLSVLMVDDDPAMLRTVSDILRFRGFNTVPARSGREGLAALATMEVPPAIALVDLKLPDMDGLDLVTRLRAISPLLEVLILTGNASVESAVRALREHSYDYLLKPVAPDELVSSITRASERWQRRRAESALEESELRLRRMFEGVGDAVFITDERQRISDANPAAVTLTSRSLDDLKNSVLHEVLTPLMGFLDIRSSAFAPGLYVHAVRDLSEQRRLETALRHAQKMEAIGRLAGGIAHDFNNLLTIIMSLGALMASVRPETDPDRLMLQEILDAAGRGATLTRQLLAFSRKQVLKPRVLTVNDAITTLQPIIRRLVGDDIRVTLQLDPGVDPVFADPGQIEQVLINLAVNARDAMPNGGELTIASSNIDIPAEPQPGVAQRSYVVLSVCDTGQGMPQSVTDQIFEPFFTTKEEGKGTGLGLSTVHGIVEQSGGFIRVQSEVEQGTTFSIHLPRYQYDAPSPN
jgi:signal transduction histidine kinase